MEVIKTKVTSPKIKNISDQSRFLYWLDCWFCLYFTSPLFPLFYPKIMNFPFIVPPTILLRPVVGRARKTNFKLVLQRRGQRMAAHASCYTGFAVKAAWLSGPLVNRCRRMLFYCGGECFSRLILDDHRGGWATLPFRAMVYQDLIECVGSCYRHGSDRDSDGHSASRRCSCFTGD